MTINNNSFFFVENLVTSMTNSFGDNAPDVAMAYAAKHERDALRIEARSAHLHDVCDSPTYVDRLTTKAQWYRELANNYMEAAIIMEGMI